MIFLGSYDCIQLHPDISTTIMEPRFRCIPCVYRQRCEKVFTHFLISSFLIISFIQGKNLSRPSWHCVKVIVPQDYWEHILCTVQTKVELFGRFESHCIWHKINTEFHKKNILLKVKHGFGFAALGLG